MRNYYQFTAYNNYCAYQTLRNGDIMNVVSVSYIRFRIHREISIDSMVIHFETGRSLGSAPPHW